MEITTIAWVIFAFFLGGIWGQHNDSRHSERSSVRDDMVKVLTPYIGKEVIFDFYEDEEDVDILSIGKKDKAILLDIDSKWAMVRIEKQNTHKDKLIRISSVKGVSVKE